MDLLKAIYYTILNPVLVDEDGSNRMAVDRRMQWELRRPFWTYTIFATKYDCGCIKRLGLWNTMYCGEHVWMKAMEP